MNDMVRVHCCGRYSGQQDWWALDTAVTLLGHRTFRSVRLLQLFTKLECAVCNEKTSDVFVLVDGRKSPSCRVKTILGICSLHNGTIPKLLLGLVLPILHFHSWWSSPATCTGDVFLCYYHINWCAEAHMNAQYNLHSVGTLWWLYTNTNISVTWNLANKNKWNNNYWIAWHMYCY